MPSWGPVLPEPFRAVSSKELLDSVYTRQAYVVENLLGCGLYILAGAPKVGKSFFVMQLARHVAEGIPLFGRNVKKGAVLYLALEDTYSRLQERSFRMFSGEVSEKLYFMTEAKGVYDGLFNQLSGFAYENPDARLVIIDTLQKVRDNAGEQLSYSNDYEVMSQLKAFADIYQLCILVVHHTRKQGSDDSFAMISGTNGLMGASDGALVLRKETRTAETAVLEVSGRDAVDQRLNLRRDRKTLAWRCEREETELWKEPPDPLLERIKRLLGGSPKWQGSATELKEAINVNMLPHYLVRKLNISASRLKDEYGIEYTNVHTMAGSDITFSHIYGANDANDAK